MCMSEFYCIKLRVSVYFFILISHLIPGKACTQPITCKKGKKRKKGREERRDRGRKSEKERKTGRGRGRVEEDRKLITTGCFRGWNKTGPISIGPHKVSFDGCLGVLCSLTLVFPLSLSLFLLPVLLWSSPGPLTWFCHQLWSFPAQFPRSRRITK